MAVRLEQLRAKLWPTRRLYEHRDAELKRELAALRQSVATLSERQEIIAERQEAMARRQEVIAEHQHGMLLWQAEMRTRLRRTQGLVARTYEAIHDWPRQLAAAREHPEYERSYSEPEPLISVVMSTYHSRDTLVDVALASARAQTYRNWEAIVVGDHCTDDTAGRVEAIGDSRIRFHNLPHGRTTRQTRSNAGPSRAACRAASRWIRPT